MRILRLFATLIPVIGLVTNMATLAIVFFGGKLVMNGSMTLGAFTAFNGYLTLLIFPIIMLGFISNVIAQASASYSRLSEVLNTPPPQRIGTEHAQLNGAIKLDHVSVTYGETHALKDVSFEVKPGTKTAIIGPTGAGKTQLLYLLTGLMQPTSGTIEYNNLPLGAYDPISLHRSIGFVFQDSILFRLSIRENIAFNTAVTEEDLRKSVETAELDEFIATLPEGMNTLVSERGTSLSGGQKQRIMLARALALNPGVLLLDDFTARVDIQTERSILRNIEQRYPGISIISVTQKIASVEDYDQIILLMEGELLAVGTHAELLHRSPEYAQIYQSQQSTNSYELHAE
jgi:ATP-binding cassette subfamily B protein